MYVDERERRSSAPAADLWRVIEGIGGENGWYSFPLAWALRGWVDKLAGGVGLRRGRRDPDTLHVGDAVDFWRVEAIERGSFLRLRAEMRVPGRAWLELRSSTAPDARARDYRQRAVFFPKGLAGSPVLVGDLPVPRLHLRGHGEPDHRRGGGGGRGTRTGARRKVTKR